MSDTDEVDQGIMQQVQKERLKIPVRKLREREDMNGGYYLIGNKLFEVYYFQSGPKSDPILVCKEFQSGGQEYFFSVITEEESESNEIWKQLQSFIRSPDNHHF